MIKISLGLVLVLFFIVWFISARNKQKKRYAKQKQVQKRIQTGTINQYIDREDIQYTINNKEKQLSEEIKKSRQDIQQAIAIANKNISTAWIDSYEKTLQITNNLQKNLEYQQNRYLQASKFQYYTSLHFRSMLAANLAYNEFRQIEESYTEINNFILQIKNGTITVNKVQKDKFYLVKNKIKDARKILLDRVHTLNRQTELFKKKIGSECGEKGRLWKAERDRHKYNK